MHGIGNDFVLVDSRSERLHTDEGELARKVCDRRFGVGADGLIFVEKSALAEVRMRMLNPDGSESEMCGNGLRCVARLVLDHGSMSIETGGRVVEAELLADGRVRVDMGLATIGRLDQEADSFTGVTVDVGNPHFVVLVDDVAAIQLEVVGPLLEHHPAFPQRTNVHFVQVVSERELIQRTWERGAGVTLACGSGACAVAVAAHALGKTKAPCEVRLPGGTLEIEIGETGQVWMTGPVETVFVGNLTL